MILLVAAVRAEPVTLDEAMARAVAHHPAIAVADARVNTTHGLELASRAAFEPVLTARAGGFSSIDEDTTQLGAWSGESSGWYTALSLTQPFSTGTTVGIDLSAARTASLYRLALFEEPFVGDPQVRSSLTFRLTQRLLEGNRLASTLAGVKAARGARARAEAERQGERQQVLAEVADAWWQAWGTAEELRFLEDAVARLGESGGGPRVEAARLRARREVESARSAAERMQDRLSRAMGDPPGPAEAGAPPELPTLPDEATVVARIAGSNAEVLVAQVAVDDANDALRAARQAMLPALDADGSYALRGYEPSLGGSFAELGRGDLPAWTVGATLTLPLYDRADRGRLAAAEGRLAEAEGRLRDLRDGLVLAAREALREVEAASRDRSLAAREGALLEEALAVETDPVERSEILLAIAEARRGEAAARARAGGAWARLRQIEGSL